jgi:rod shape-determining protein MreC
VNRRRVLRRRIVVAILLVLCIGMLTAYFRESNSGAAHELQNGVLQVVAPLQSGTARVTKPFRDAWNWAGDLFGAKSENARLRRELQVLQAGVADELATQAQNTEMTSLLGLQREHIFPQGVKLVSGRVVARSTSAWYSTVTIDVGSTSGVRVNDAVVNGDGLVGRVTEVYSAESQVTLLTDQQSFVDAMVLPGGATGMVAGSVTGDVTLEYVDKSEKVKVGQDVVTSGMSRSIFTRGIPIGVVQSVGTQDVELYQSVSVQPYVDFRKLDLVQVVLR